MTVPMIRLNQVTAAFNGYKALENISTEFYSGQVCCVLGENGAGKSTLGKLIAGVIPHTGKVWLHDRAEDKLTLSRSQSVSVGISFQEEMLFKNLTVAQNILINHEVKHSAVPLLDNRATDQLAEDALALFEGFHLDVHRKVSSLSLAECKIVELCRAIHLQPQVLVLDEPAAALDVVQVEVLFSIIRRLRSQGVCIIYITHNVNDIYAIGDRVLILNSGKLVSDTQVSELANKESMVHNMVGENYFNHYPKTPAKIGEPVLEAQKVSNALQTVSDVSFTLHSGEILGIAGLQGVGKSSLLKLLFGLEPLKNGSVSINGSVFQRLSPVRAIRCGMAYVSDHPSENVFPSMSNIENIMIGLLHKFTLHGLIEWDKLKLRAREAMHYFRIQTPVSSAKTRQLSLGNIQKSMLCRWALMDSSIYLLDDPTKHLDISSKVDLYNIMNQMAHNGTAIVLVSSDLEELLGMSDRILIMNAGTIVKEIDAHSSNCEEILNYSFDF